MTIINDVHIALSRCVDGAIELRRQRDALLEACEITLGYNSTGGIKNGLPQKLIDQIRAAIALVKEPYDHDSEAAEKDRGCGYDD